MGAYRHRTQPSQIERYALIGAVEGNQEILYFKRLKKIIDNQDPVKRLVVRYEDAGGGSALNVAIRASKADVLSHQSRSAVFDFDNQLVAFKEALAYCRHTKIVPCYSNVCFDLWLLLHKTDFCKPVYTPADYTEEYRMVYHLGVQEDIKEESTIEKVMDQIELQDVRDAIARAKSIRERKNGTPNFGYTRFCGRDEACHDNPDLLIHLFIEEILCECLGRNR